MSMIEEQYQKAVLVDQDGYFVGAIKWRKGTPRPRINAKGTPAHAKLKALQSPEAVAEPIEGGKWDEEAKKWRKPDTLIWIVCQRRDKPRYWTLVSERKVWPDRLPRLPNGHAFIDTPPPKTHSKKPVWDDEGEFWIFPKRAIVVLEDGTELPPQLVLEEVDAVVPEGASVRFEEVCKAAKKTGKKK